MTFSCLVLVSYEIAMNTLEEPKHYITAVKQSSVWVNSVVFLLASHYNEAACKKHMSRVITSHPRGF